MTIVLRCLTMMHGGGETRHLAWARELRAAGDDVTVITGAPMAAAARYAVEPGTIVIRSPYTRDLVYRLQGRRGFGRFGAGLLHADEEWFCRAAWRRIAAARERPDVVHFHALGQAARLKRASIPTVVNLPGEPHRRYFADLRLADAVVADGWAARHLPSLLGCRVDNVPKGVDTDRFTPDGPDLRASMRLDEACVALVVSRLVPIKNVGLAIDAVARVAAAHPALRLVVVGDGPQRPMLEARARTLGIADRLLFAGAVPHADVPAWYRTADFFVLPSAFDNSPNVALEAMASGLPVIATDVGGLREYVADGINGYLVPADDQRILGERIADCAADAARVRRIGAHNRDEAVRRYSWAESARALRAVYARVVDRTRRAA